MSAKGEIFYGLVPYPSGLGALYAIVEGVPVLGQCGTSADILASWLPFREGDVSKTDDPKFVSYNGLKIELNKVYKKSVSGDATWYRYKLPNLNEPIDTTELACDPVLKA